MAKSRVALSLARNLDAAASLKSLARKVAANPAARNPKPEFLTVVVGAGEYALFDRDLGVYILPITCLGV